MNVVNLRARRAMGMKERYWYNKGNFGMNVVEFEGKALVLKKFGYGRGVGGLKARWPGMEDVEGLFVK